MERLERLLSRSGQARAARSDSLLLSLLLSPLVCGPGPHMGCAVLDRTRRFTVCGLRTHTARGGARVVLRVPGDDRASHRRLLNVSNFVLAGEPQAALAPALRRDHKKAGVAHLA